MKSFVVVIVALVMLGASEAFACAVCGTARAPNDWAFGLTTALLSFLPPTIFGGIVFFIVRAHKKARREENSTFFTPD